MKKVSKFKMQNWFFALFLLFVFSCSKDNQNEVENSAIIQNENFVGLSVAKQIAGEIKFESSSQTSNSKTTKSSLSNVKKRIETIEEVKNDQGNTVFYVINYVEGGYIILSSDNRTQPIIAFADENKFVLDKGIDVSYPAALASWVTNAKKQISSIQKSTRKQTLLEKSVWNNVSDSFVNKGMYMKVPPDKCYDKVTTETVGPFLRALWCQDTGFNDDMPYVACNGGPQRALAGCVPIAMAQVMRHYEYPTNYDWSMMPITSATAATATFIADVHTAIRSMYPGQPSYSCSGTGVTANLDMGKVLKTKFNYTSADVAGYNYLVVKNDLAQGRPVLLSGFNGLAGHMWVCDGYKAIKYDFSDCTGFSTLHFNMKWGWKDKSSDGFFAYNNFGVGEVDSGGNTGYNKSITMIYNIKP